MPWSRAITAAFTMLTPSIRGDMRPASMAAVRGRVFRLATRPSYSIVTLVSAPSLACQEKIAHLFSDLQRDVLLRLSGRGAEMRRADDVLQPKEWRLVGRLGFEHIERGARDMAGLDRIRQGFFVDQTATGTVDDAD